MKKIAVALLLIISVYFATLMFLRLDPNVPERGHVQCIPILEYEEKSGIKILTMKECSSYDAGYFHGEELEKEIHELVDFFKNEMLLGGKDKYTGGLIYSLLQYKAQNFVEYIPDSYMQEMKGVADGAGVSFNDILLINTYDDLLQMAGCSSMISPKQDGLNDVFIHTRNLDYPISILAKYKIVLKYDTHISVGFPGYIGVLTGVGEKGLSLSTHTSYSKNKPSFGIPSGLLYRIIITNAQSIDEVKDILDKSERTIANNVMIGEYKNNIGIVAEIDSQQTAYREAGKNEGILVSTNHFRSPKMIEVATSREGTRYGQYFEKVDNLEKITLEKVVEILKYYKKSNYWETISNNGTVQSVIMAPGLRKVFVANGEKIPVSQGEYIEIEY